MLYSAGLRAVLAIALGWGAQAVMVDAAPVSGEAIKAHTAFLSDDLLEGREAGTRGYDIAAAYVATQFALYGLKPAGANPDFYQKVPLRRRSLQPDGVRFEMRTKSGAQLYQNGRDIAVDASATTLDEVIEADVVFAGWGIRAPGLRHDDYAGLNVRGKAVVILEGAPASFPGALRAHYSWIQQKERMAAEAGAIALLTLKSPEREQFSPWERTRQARPLPALGWTDPAQREHAPTIKATITLGPEVARSLFAQGGRNVDEIYQQSISSPPRGFNLPASIRLARKSVHEDSSTSNVIGVLPGTDASLKNEYIVVASHLDAWVGPKAGPDTIYNGAVDNAGGIAAMLEVARVLSAAGGAKRSVLFFATAAEEKGLLGSDYFVAHPLVPLHDIVGAISVDGLMAFHDFAGIVALGAEHSTLGEISLVAARSIGAVHEPDPIPGRGNLALSDQYPFLRVGIPVLFPNPARGSRRGGGEDVAAWDEYESRHYHQPSDAMKLPLRWDVAERWGQYMYAVVAGAANGSRRPLWYEADELAAVFAPTAARVKRP
ncbi:M20/M25/M40 family metallo-hydrolase [Steroidobacter agaridevorans]|uniref:M20/M25/M40 family metallo-hydrolase n=1 Tax=Steroidobacter agaridevorans TaxID=2695856 RepID=UPI00132B9207|nr:M20/M25/M40 family metallo-hydrolase [Steroidobacter agaridevorans]GFE86485.1 aminopeptidase [Steroidobacter agaridevorans]